MKITVAGVNKEVTDNLTVAQLVIDEKVETPEYVTVTINDEFVESFISWEVVSNGFYK